MLEAESDDSAPSLGPARDPHGGVGASTSTTGTTRHRRGAGRPMSRAGTLSHGYAGGGNPWYDHHEEMMWGYPMDWQFA